MSRTATNNSNSQQESKTEKDAKSNNDANATIDKAAAEKEAADKAAAEKEAALKSENTPILEKTRDNYVVPEKEKKDYHAVIEVQRFNASNGKRLSRPRLQKFSPAAWRGFAANAASLGYTVTILHDPTGEYPTTGVVEEKNQ